MKGKPLTELEASLGEGLSCELNAALKRLQLWPLEGAKPLTLGLSNQNWLLQAGSESMVLRVNSPGSDRICDRNNELACWRVAEKANLAPGLIWVSADKGLYLSRFIEQAPQANWQQLLASKGAAEIASAAQKAYVNSKNLSGLPEPKHDSKHESKHEPRHDSKHDVGSGAVLGARQGKSPQALLLELLLGLRALPTPKLEISVAEQWRIYLERLDDMALSRGQPSSWQQRLMQLHSAQGLFEQCNTRLEACLLRLQYCHRDLNPHNLLLAENGLKCVDFEYACASHPLFELAGVLSSHQLSADGQQWLIYHYLEQHPHLTDDAHLAVAAAVDVYWLFACCWALQMAWDNQQQSYLDWFDDFWHLVKHQ
ncbi:phosphotransferase [Shewanella indica]